MQTISAKVTCRYFH